MNSGPGATSAQPRLARVHIDGAALSHNLARVKHYAPDSRVMAVIKANAYGHGALAACRHLEAADAFALATTGEALALREAGVDTPLVVLQGFADSAELETQAAHALQPVIIDESQVDVLQNHGGEALSVWLKIDTGMHRLGVPAAEAVRVLARVRASAAVTEVRLMSHYANADTPEDRYNNSQLECFLDILNEVNIEASMANSAALVALPDSRLQWVRPGIMLYGSSPLAGTDADQLGLRAVMNFESRLLAVRGLQQGDAVGYGSTWRCPRDMRVGVVAAGYADGYPRHAPSGTPVWVNGRACPLLGRVSMDSITIDLSEVDAARGDRVVLWGRELSVDRIAEAAGTIGYELLCQAGNAVG